MRLQLIAMTLLLVVPQTSPPVQGILEGHVLKAGTVEPLANTPVTLISSPGLSDDALAGLLDRISQLVTVGSQGGGGGATQDLTTQGVMKLLQNAGPGVGAQASILTDRTGHYAFPNLPRGRYTVWVQRFNYFGPVLNGVPTSTTSATIEFDPSKPQPVDLFLTPGVAISGRVVDSQSQPALGSSITAYRRTYNDGNPLWSQVVTRQIDDRGEYRLSPLPPGDYYVGVTPSPNSTASAAQDVPVRTFFPGVTEPADATKLVLKGGDTPGMNFTLRSAPASFFKISGIALNPRTASSPAGVTDRGFSSFTLIPRDSNLVDNSNSIAYANAVPAANRAAGEFELRNVRPGVYELYPAANFGGFLSGKTIVDVRNSDAAGVRVVVSPMVTLQGQVLANAADSQNRLSLEMLQIVAKPAAAISSRSGTAPLKQVAADGTFAVSGPAGAAAMIQVNGLPDTAFVSDIRMSSGSVLNHGFVWPSTSEQLQILVDTTTGASVEVTAQTTDGRPGKRATVVLVPEEDKRQNPMGYKSGTTDNDGRLTFRGVAPGSYTAIAWESVSPTAWLNKEFIEKYSDQGTPINIAPGKPVSLPLKWIEFDADRQ